jgi:hypothetical protein
MRGMIDCCVGVQRAWLDYVHARLHVQVLSTVFIVPLRTCFWHSVYTVLHALCTCCAAGMVCIYMRVYTYIYVL